MENSKLDKEILDIAEYLGCNGAELLSELKPIINNEKIAYAIEELERFSNATISHGGSPAPFNPEGLPIHTSRTEEMTRLVRETAQTRINELKATLKKGSTHGNS